MTVKDIGSEVKGAFEVIRRGETEKEIIIPLRGSAPSLRKEEEPPPRIALEPDGTDRPAT